MFRPGIDSAVLALGLDARNRRRRGSRRLLPTRRSLGGGGGGGGAQGGQNLWLLPTPAVKARHMKQ